MKTFDTAAKNETQRTQIGPFESWIENGSLRIYSHKVGQATGFSMKMTPEETQLLLEWLSKHHENISLSARTR